MKGLELTWVLTVFAVFWSGCNDLSTVNPSEPSRGEKMNEIPLPYPLNTRLTNAQGREIRVRILGKSRGEVAFVKADNEKHYVIPISSLSKGSQDEVYDLPDGGQFELVKKRMRQETELQNRDAVWHNQFGSAQKESSESHLPLLLLIIATGDPVGEELEKHLIYNKTFNEFADRTLVLCSLPMDPVGSRKRTSIEAQRTQNLALKLGVSPSTSSIIIFPPGNLRRRVLETWNISNTETAIREIKANLPKGF